MKKKRPELYRNEIKSYIVRAGMTMSEVVDFLADEYGWSSSVPNLSGKLKRGSLRYGEAVELADALGYGNVCLAVLPMRWTSFPLIAAETAAFFPSWYIPNGQRYTF